MQTQTLGKGLEPADVRLVAVVAEDEADTALARMQALPEGAGAADIGFLAEDGRAVEMETALGGRRILEELEDDPLPRIC